MASERTDELYKLLLGRGYPKEFCAEIAYRNMNTDYTATRMLGYLYRVSDPRIEDLVDEIMDLWLHANIESHSFIEADYWKKNYDMVRKLISEAEVYVAEENEEIQALLV